MISRLSIGRRIVTGRRRLRLLFSRTMIGRWSIPYIGRRIVTGRHLFSRTMIGRWSIPYRQRLLSTRGIICRQMSAGRSLCDFTRTSIITRRRSRRRRGTAPTNLLMGFARAEAAGSVRLVNMMIAFLIAFLRICTVARLGSLATAVAQESRIEAIGETATAVPWRLGIGGTLATA
jgi:hypothetical protein